MVRFGKIDFPMNHNELSRRRRKSPVAASPRFESHLVAILFPRTVSHASSAFSVEEFSGSYALSPKPNIRLLARFRTAGISLRVEGRENANPQYQLIDGHGLTLLKQKYRCGGFLFLIVRGTKARKSPDGSF